MNILTRISNLWSWSALPAPKDAFFQDEKGSGLIKRSTERLYTPEQKAQVISYKPRDPVKEITEQDPNDTNQTVR